MNKVIATKRASVSLRSQHRKAPLQRRYVAILRRVIHALTAVIAVAQMACAGEGEQERVRGNLTASALQVTSEVPQIGYPLRVSVTVETDAPRDQLHVSLFAAEKGEDPEAEGRQIPIGTETVENVAVGSRTVDIELPVPSSVNTPGEYYLTAIVDAADQIRETDEEDNAASAEVVFSRSLRPNVFLANLALDRNALEINTSSYEEQVTGDADNVYNSDAGGRITVGADGLAVDQTVDIEAYARLRIERTDNETSFDVPLYLWNSDTQRYINAYGVDPNGSILGGVEVEWLPLGRFEPQLVTNEGDAVVLDDARRNSTHINFYFPGRLGSELELAMRYPDRVTTLSPPEPPPDLTAAAIVALRSFLRSLPSNGVEGDPSAALAIVRFSICVAIRSVDNEVEDEALDDNTRCAPIVISLPPLDPPPPPNPSLQGYTPRFTTPSESFDQNDGFKTRVGGSVFAFGLDFGASITADEHGYIEELHAVAPVTVLGVSFEYAGIRARAQLVPDYPGKPPEDESSFVVEIIHAGQMLADVYEIPAGTTISVSFDELTFSKEYPDPETRGFAEATFFVGPIPLSVGAYVVGSLGVDYQPIVFTDDHPDGYELGVAGGPYTNLEGIVYAGFGSRRGPVIVGVEGVLSLFDERIVLANTARIEVVENQDSADPVELVIEQGPKITNYFTGTRGKINLFAEFTVPVIKKCKIGLIKIPCPGFKKLKVVKNLWSSPALFELNDVLYDDPQLQLGVVLFEGEEPQYFVP